MTPRAAPRFAVVRRLGPAYAEALGQSPDAPPIDLARAQAQHAAYVAALKDLDLVVLELDDHGLPDACFVEDTAIVVGRDALLTRPGAPSRRAEVDAVGAALMGLGVRVTPMTEPATLDGGDVLRLGDRLLVGRSARTNDEGIAALEAYARPLGLAVHVLDVPPETLHLKCHATSPVEGLVVVARDVLPPEQVPPGWRIVKIPDKEAYAANTLGVGDEVLVAAGFPEAARAIAAALPAGRVVTLDTSELAKAAGSLTCLSLLVE
ncbi:MAG: N(G),N(G)-dimethylarginine dimethylaminohydrolase [Deltaproteobacteria bacterium]|nr:N(G),N(G)-dimethylarginine dimethylaminohydrolase [Deltaproteobacteria bacterium]